jgi:hypothetical protein
MENTTPPSTEGLLFEMLPQFGLADPRDISSWPYLEEGGRSINRLVATFTCAGQRYLMKARTVEHRGAKSLFETQNILKAFYQRGVSVPALHRAPDGQTLILGPDPRDESGAHFEVQRFLLGPEFYHVPAVYYEIQHLIPGQPPPADEHTAYRVGAVLAAFHAAGHQPEIRSLAPEERHLVAPHVDTHLLNKALYINIFIQRRVARNRELHAYVKDLKAVSPEEQRKIDDLFCRIDAGSWQSGLSWGIIHGDFCANNVIVCDKNLFIIDFDEVGLGPISHDIGDFFGDLEEAGLRKSHALVKGYMENGGKLSDADRTAIVDGLVLQQIATACGNGLRELEINRLFADGWALF